MAHQGNVPGVMEELVHHAKSPAGGAKGRGMHGTVHEANEVQDYDGQQKPWSQSGQARLSDVPREYG